MNNYEEEYDRISNEMDREVCDYVGEDCLVLYSAWPYDDNKLPRNNLNEVAVTGKVLFRAERDEFYGGKDSQDWKSPTLENPTWLELCKQAHNMILVTGDEHHCFLEGIEIAYTCSANNVKVAELVMGS